MKKLELILFFFWGVVMSEAGIHLNNKYFWFLWIIFALNNLISYAIGFKEGRNENFE